MYMHFHILILVEKNRHINHMNFKKLNRKSFSQKLKSFIIILCLFLKQKKAWNHSCELLNNYDIVRV